MAPTLQQLDLRGSSVPFCPVDVDLSATPSRQVHLENLRSLRLFSGPWECLNICRNLVLPPTTKHWLDATFEPENTLKVSLELLLSFIVSISQRPVQTLEIVRDTVELGMYLDDAYRRYAGNDFLDVHQGNLFMVLKFYDPGCARNVLLTLVHPDISLAMSWSSILSVYDAVIVDFCTKHLDISQLERLRLSEFGLFKWNPGAPFFLNHFDHLLSLRIVVVEMGGMPEAFIDALLEDLCTLESPPSRPSAFPALKEIHIVGYAFAGENDGETSPAQDFA
ncbi:hypothetical protein DL96DRAFT_481836 [Flagelloscypha sp. PMI_526]|nr:hypothetical protein DL96DRAFT_481836 [Flagelloscypha sp. PMI_526]